MRKYYRNEQIEDMTTEIYETLMLEAECPLSGMDCAIIADLLVRKKGYRKASEVAREIFAEMEKLLIIDNFRLICNRSDFAELKKKYLEVDEDAER